MTNFSNDMLANLNNAPDQRSGENIAIWCHVIGKRGDKLVIKIGEAEFLLDPSSIKNVEVLDGNSISDPSSDVFLEIDGDSEIVSSVKNIARFGHRAQSEILTPFALARPEQAATRKLSDDEVREQNDIYDAWQRKVGIFKELTNSSKEERCTLKNTSAWTSFGPLDIPSGVDHHGDGCAGY
ncbi:hypothetical protein WNZ14_21825 [Hoeflea sp. AS60]|uniref:hypothetical protein n=1 Tax=Hoeflea sp. AS60 TaxID=3135780 RepID=UPI00317F5779